MNGQGFELLYEQGPCLGILKPAGLATQAPAGIDSLVELDQLPGPFQVVDTLSERAIGHELGMSKSGVSANLLTISEQTVGGDRRAYRHRN